MAYFKFIGEPKTPHAKEKLTFCGQWTEGGTYYVNDDLIDTYEGNKMYIPDAYIKDDAGIEHWVELHRFERVYEVKEKTPKFKKGDRVEPTGDSGQWTQYFTEAYTDKYPAYVDMVWQQRYVIKFRDSYGRMRSQVVSEDVIKPYVYEEQEDETSSQLVLMKAEFMDSEGRKVTVKRSPCRHYYFKVEGSKQKRVSLREIKEVVRHV